jgi:hypothetical protein
MSQQHIPDARLRHLAGRLHDLGPRPLYEFLREIERGADLLQRLERYAELDPAIVAAIGAYAIPVVATCIWGRP